MLRKWKLNTHCFAVKQYFKLLCSRLGTYKMRNESNRNEIKLKRNETVKKIIQNRHTMKLILKYYATALKQFTVVKSSDCYLESAFHNSKREFL